MKSKPIDKNYILATDVYYQENQAVAAGVLFSDWGDRSPLSQLTIPIEQVSDYEPGQFYRRELPCILELLQQLKNLPTHIIVDGYVYLDSTQKPGLGKYLYDALQAKSVVIGVAKNRFKDIAEESELLRGASQKPLYVTAAGISILEAKDLIARMHGQYRLPEMLKLVDHLSRQII